MKFLVTVVTLFYVLAKVDYVKSQNTVKTKTIKQKLDHFDENNDKTWDMRYMVTEKYFKDGSPMFILVGAEQEIKAAYIESGLLSEVAKQHNGILFYTEHRFYGKSRPTSDLSMENLKYLSARQALADLAHFIRYQRQHDPRLSKSKVFLAGCSYGGTLVIWFNRLYKDLVDGSWAMSAPTLSKVDFKEFNEIVGTSIKELGSPQCYDRISNGISELEKMFNGDRAEDAKKILNLCDEFNSTDKMNLWSIFRGISGIIADFVLYPKPNKDVRTQCDWIMKQKDDVTPIAAFLQENYKTCVSLDYNADRYFYSQTKYNDGPGVSRTWLYQMCNEFGNFQTTSSSKQPFGTNVPVSKDLQQCADVFGPEYTADHIYKLIDKTNTIFGGMNPNVKNVYMTQCSLDPWSVLAPGAEEQHVSVIHNCLHCSHMYSIRRDESPEMRASKERVFELARKWLA